ncbi:MAG: formylglycine-generating enzyme family protein [Leptospiraceae bacterium]|nr:formylglycine-generating enzyme family protein [Leptospiraceae bacterium]
MHTVASISAFANPGLQGDNGARTDQHPVTTVNWSAKGYRLPTEAEWEYAARYIDGSNFAQGDHASGATVVATTDFTATALVAWFGNSLTINIGNTTTSQLVGTKLGNALGLFDLSGNVREWVSDWEGPYAQATPFIDADSVGPVTGTFRVNRGGGWLNPANFLQGAFRNGNFPWLTTSALGFRPVRRP